MLLRIVTGKLDVFQKHSKDIFMSEVPIDDIIYINRQCSISEKVNVLVKAYIDNFNFNINNKMLTSIIKYIYVEDTSDISIIYDFISYFNNKIENKIVPNIVPNFYYVGYDKKELFDLLLKDNDKETTELIDKRTSGKGGYAICINTIEAMDRVRHVSCNKNDIKKWRSELKNWIEKINGHTEMNKTSRSDKEIKTKSKNKEA